MAVNLYHAVNLDGLFNIQGKSFFAQQTINTARGTTVPAEIDDVSEIANNLTVEGELEKIIGGFSSDSEAFKNVGAQQMSSQQAFARNLLIKMVDDDVALSEKTFLAAINELIGQMVSNSDSVNASTVTLAVANGASNTGDGRIVLSTKRGDGLAQENIVAETISVEANGDGLTTDFEFEGEESVPLLDARWPRGSGVKIGISGVDATASLLANGAMEDEDDVPNAPDDIVFSVATIGTTVKMTDVEVQTITITGTPIGGHYLIHWTDPDSNAQTTVPIAWNATQSTVQSALRLLIGLESITVATTGTSPDFTHTITFTGQGGNLNEVTVTDNTTGGTPSFTPATTVAGTPQVFSGSKALHIDSNGAELTTWQWPLTTLESETAYAISLWAITDSIPVGGVFTIDLVDGIGGTVIQDSQGANNSFTFDASDLTTSQQHLSALVTGETVFRTPLVVPDIVYFRMRTSTAVSNTSSVFIDHVAMAKMSELYAGGPMISIFSGSKPFKKEDSFTVTATNDRAGVNQEWYQRNFDMASLGLLLPSNAAGGETIPDSVVS